MPTEKKHKKDKPETSEKKQSEAEKRFVRDLMIRGEAVEAEECEELPPGATHRIVENDSDSEPQAERERFSIY